MSATLSTSNQARWKDSYAASAKVGLTLRANGEEPVQVFTQDRQLVAAGFDAPTVAPTVADGGVGSLTAGYVAYAYCYASSNYANVEALVAAGGEEWPKSNPSPASATYSITASHRNTVTVTKSGRSDVDKILVYRTAIKSTAAEATALAVAGEMFYMGVVDDNAVPGTTTYSDNVVAMQEQMELDNYTAPQFWLTVYEDPHWWGLGNPALDANVTLNNTSSIVAAANTFYSGRNGQLVTFDGITTGGFDGKGTWYFKYLSDSVATVSADPLLSTAATVPATGTTVMRARGYAGTLYRSKPRNPFSWGFTELQYASDNSSVQRVPQQYAFTLGGSGAAMAVLPEQRLLKLDVENPPACYTLNLSLAGQDGFEATKRVLSRQYSVSSHHAQFSSLLSDSTTGLVGIDAGNATLTRSTAGGQAAFGDEVFNTLRSMVVDGDAARLNHGVFDPLTELSVFWIKTATDPDNLIYIDTAICFHAPSGQFSTFRDFDVTASASVYDPVTLATLILVGTASGQIAQAFASGVNSNLVDSNDAAKFAFTYTTPTSERTGIQFTGAPSDPPPAGGSYFDIADRSGPVRVWFYDPTTPTAAPAIPTGGRLLMCDTGGAIQILDMMSNLVFTLDGDDAFTVFASGSTSLSVDVDETGRVDAPNAGTVGGGALTLTRLVIGSDGVALTPALAASEVGTWALAVSGVNEFWTVANAQGEFDFRTNFVNGEATSVTPLSVGATGILFPGLINCEAQTYFQPSQSKAQQAREIWSTFRNHDANGSLFYRFYREFDTTATGAAITPTQTTHQSDSAASMNWVARAGVNTELVNQAGYRLVERGYEDFEVLGLDVKNHSTGR